MSGKLRYGSIRYASLNDPIFHKKKDEPLSKKGNSSDVGSGRW